MKKQVESLSILKHSLSYVIFIVPQWSGEPAKFTEATENLPQTIGGAKVRRLRCKQQGISYGAWLQGFEAHPDFQRYLFLEDDYVFDIDDFDLRLRAIFEDIPGCGYVCGALEGLESGAVFSISNGMTSDRVLRGRLGCEEWHMCKGDRTKELAREFDRVGRFGRVARGYPPEYFYSQIVFSRMFLKEFTAVDVGTYYSVTYRCSKSGGYRCYHPGKPLIMRAL